MKYYLFDTCFWFGLLCPDDQYFQRAQQMFEQFEDSEVKILVPFPSLYETLNTEFVDNKQCLSEFNRIINDTNKVELIEDIDYKDNAYYSTIWQHKDTKISFVDNIIMEITKSAKIRVDSIVSFNERDFSNFCKERRIPLICYPNCIC